MAEKDTDILERYTEPLSHRIEKEYAIGEEFYHGEVKKGLRNSDGTARGCRPPGGCIIAASS